MEQDVKCPVCLSLDEYRCIRTPFLHDALLFNCEVCGKFAVSRTAIDDYLDLRMPGMTPMRRAALSHKIRQFTDNDERPSLWTTDNLSDFCEGDNVLPTPSQQVVNIIRYIGERIEESGKTLGKLPPSFHAAVGSPNRSFCMDLVIEIERRGLITCTSMQALSGPPMVHQVGLTLSGWDIYEQEKSGKISTKTGFMALRFGDVILDALLKDHIKPAVNSLGYHLVDMRDVSKAGIIDNLMRVQIRDSAFVLADLTHENAGAYWEAGYAEGLGKPVLYICEKAKFDERKSHFDTNHCTTVLWESDNPSNFTQDLIATLKRSLDI